MRVLSVLVPPRPVHPSALYWTVAAAERPMLVGPCCPLEFICFYIINLLRDEKERNLLEWEIERVTQTEKDKNSSFNLLRP